MTLGVTKFWQNANIVIFFRNKINIWLTKRVLIFFSFISTQSCDFWIKIFFTYTGHQKCIFNYSYYIYYIAFLGDDTENLISKFRICCRPTKLACIHRIVSALYIQTHRRTGISVPWSLAPSPQIISLVIITADLWVWHENNWILSRDHEHPSDGRLTNGQSYFSILFSILL